MQHLAPHHTTPLRLDIALVELLEMSRAKVQKLIAAQCVFVNGQPAQSAHILVSSRDAIDVHDAPPEDAVSSTLPSLSILFEDDDVCVVEKAAGTLVHPTASSRAHAPTLMDALLAHYPAMKDVGGDLLRSGVVHRLDKDASGVIIFAKNEKAHAWLKEQFKTRQTTKIYDVLVLGHVLDEAGTITFPIARTTGGGRMAARPLSQEGKDAITHYDVVTHYSSSTRLRVRIETGRTHQIRVHFFALGYPVAGDTLYTHKKLKQLPLHRLFLHARELGITLPSGEHTTFVSPLPQELETFLTTLKPGRL